MIQCYRNRQLSECFRFPVRIHRNMQGVTMKKLLLISVFIILMFPLFSESWGTKKIEELTSEKHDREGNFILSVVPYTEELYIANDYEEWIQKRYSKTRMVEEAKKIIRELDNGMIAILYFRYLGDYDSPGRTSIDIPTDFHEYIFAENERGEYLRCTDTEGSHSSIGYFNELRTLILTFSKLTDDGKDIFENANELIFVIEGLGFEQNRISYSLPLSDYFTDIPEEQREILLKANE